MTKIKGIVRLEGRGITAKVTDSGELYSTYQRFANAAGYPDAAVELGRTNSKIAELSRRKGEEFNVLARGPHDIEYGVYICVIESTDGKRFLVGEEGLEISENDVDSSLETSEKIEKLVAKMRRQAYAEGYEQGKFGLRMETSIKEIANIIEETAQEKRDRIIEQAVKDVEELKNHGISENESSIGNYTHRKLFYAVKFVVNKEKRTVVALVRSSIDNAVFERGIAKCAPDDCFNVHIGKAIALRRALGLDVPEDYIFAPQPTEVRLGDVTKSINTGTEYVITERAEAFDVYGYGRGFRSNIGGGPGSGPIGVSEELAPFLPKPVVRSNDGVYEFDYDRPQSIGMVKNFYGNFGINVRAYTYIRTMGAEGLKKVSEYAVLNANYIMRNLEKEYDLPFAQHCKHEFVLSGNAQKKLGVRTLDVAKRLMDFDIHPPTVYFPLIVEEALMIEPTETESKETLDHFIDTMLQIADEAKNNPEIIHEAPHHTSVKRLDEVRASRKPVLRYQKED